MDDDIRHILESSEIPNLPLEEMRTFIERMKTTADSYWRKDAHVSLRIAEKMIYLGHCFEEIYFVALGTMARGDALKLLRRTQEAWDTLDEAGRLFRENEDEVGWARTRIGRLGICIDVRQKETALNEADQARHILIRHERWDRLVMLEMNTGVIYDLLGDFTSSLAHYQQAVDYAFKAGDEASNYLSVLYINLGFAFQGLGRLREALDVYQASHQLLSERGDLGVQALVQLNIASIQQLQGHYRRALITFDEVIDEIRARLPSEAPAALRTMIECYLALGRYTKAYDLVQNLIHDYPDAYHDIVSTLFQLTTVQVELGLLEEAQQTLDQAQVALRALDSEVWVASLALRQGQIALRRGDLVRARAEATSAGDIFQRHPIQHGMARLLQAKVALLEGQLSEAVTAGTEALRIAQRTRLPSLRYSTHLHLGHTAAQAGRMQQAVRHFNIAVQAVEQVQRGLTLTLRPAFMENRLEALHALIRLYLDSDKQAKALELLERAKAQVWISSLAHRDNLRWKSDHPQMQPLLEELNRLREAHRWIFQLAHEPAFRAKRRITSPTPEEAATLLHDHEQAMRAITEKLYLYSHRDVQLQPQHPTLHQLQVALPDDTLLVEYYEDGHTLSVFTLSQSSLRHRTLQTSLDTVRQSIDQFQSNVSRALRTGATAPATAQLATRLKTISQELYTALMEPIAEEAAHYQRLIVVPYGPLHYLPFHLLFDGQQYLIEQHELVVLPAAGLLLQPPVQQAGTAPLILACSSNGRLPQVEAEAQQVQAITGGVCYPDAKRTVLDCTPGTVLHIAAHGEFRIHQPDFSYIELRDGQLYADDLFQHDLGYELVTLSACETGRVNATSGEDLIGLGRGFLFAGAGALIASLWRVEDTRTADMMQTLYQLLMSGASKAQALQCMMLEQLAQQPSLHPAFWGAFQLIGNPAPLSHTSC